MPKVQLKLRDRYTLLISDDSKLTEEFTKLKDEAYEQAEFPETTEAINKLNEARESKDTDFIFQAGREFDLLRKKAELALKTAIVGLNNQTRELLIKEGYKLESSKDTIEITSQQGDSERITTETWSK